MHWNVAGGVVDDGWLCMLIKAIFLGVFLYCSTHPDVASYHNTHIIPQHAHHTTTHTHIIQQHTQELQARIQGLERSCTAVSKVARHRNHNEAGLRQRVEELEVCVCVTGY